MAENQDQDKSTQTEEPTETKLRKAREKGDVWTSREAGTLLSVFSLFVIATFLAPSVSVELTVLLGAVFELSGAATVGEGFAGLTELTDLMHQLTLDLAGSMGSVFTLMIVGALVSLVIKGPTVVAVERIKPKLNKISPIQGFKRLFSADALVEAFKSTLKVIVIVAISMWVAYQTVSQIWQSESVLIERFLPYMGEATNLLLILSVAFLVPVTIADILWKRAQWFKKQRMSIKEIRDEQKESEGDPLIKRRRSELQFERSRQRIAIVVPTASVILTNPTHYSVALKYDPDEDEAPVCVAKGVDHMAAQIRKIGRAHDIPIIENRALARSLHNVAEVGQVIPFEHWQAVAEVISYVMDLKRRIYRSPPFGSELREED